MGESPYFFTNELSASSEFEASGPNHSQSVVPTSISSLEAKNTFYVLAAEHGLNSIGGAMNTFCPESERRKAH